MFKRNFSLFIILILMVGCSSYPISMEKPIESAEISSQHMVLVLGTVHLSAYDSRLIRNLPKLRQLLKDWSPTKIAIEDRRPDLIHKASVYSKFDSGYQKLLEMFDGKDVTWAEKISRKHKITYETSLEKVHKMLLNEKHLSDDDRIQLVRYLIVSYDVPNAVLQWSKLPTKYQEETLAISKDDKSELNRLLNLQSETYSLAVTLARELNHSQVYSVDSQEDGVSMLSIPSDKMNQFFSDPRGKQFNDSKFMKEDKRMVEETLNNGDIVSLYRFINKNSEQYEHQWDWLLNDSHPTGAQILRYSNWEARNLRILSSLQDISASTETERILLIIGASHKSILDKYLRNNKSVRLAQFEDLFLQSK